MTRITITLEDTAEGFVDAQFEVPSGEPDSHALRMADQIHTFIGLVAQEQEVFTAPKSEAKSPKLIVVDSKLLTAQR